MSSEDLAFIRQAESYLNKALVCLAQVGINSDDVSFENGVHFSDLVKVTETTVAQSTCCLKVLGNRVEEKLAHVLEKKEA